jgi:hypothetical protein
MIEYISLVLIIFSFFMNLILFGGISALHDMIKILLLQQVENPEIENKNDYTKWDDGEC